MGRNDNYWQEREKKWIEQNIRDDKAYQREIAKHYEQSLKNIKDDINKFYINYADKEHITLEEARKAISSFGVKSFASEAKAMVKNKDFSSYANERLRVYNATMRINRLEYLKAQVGKELVNLNGKEEAALHKYLGEKYVDEVKRQSGILGLNKLDNLVKSTQKIVQASFHGANFSQRIWVNNDALKGKLDELLTRSLVRGINPNVLARELYSQVSDSMTSSRYAAERLMRTETARVQDQAQMDSIKAGGYEYCHWVAEPTACGECTEIAESNEGIYLITEVPGIPVHASCRCSKAASMGPKNRANNEVDRIKQRMNDIDMSTASYDDLTNLGSLVNKEHDMAKFVGNKEKLKEIFGNYRDMGGTLPKEAWYKRSNTMTKNQLQNAFSVYPKQWSDYITDNNKQLFAGKTRRGFFSEELVNSNGSRYLNGAKRLDGISIYSSGSRATTPFHEIGHMVDHFNSNLVRIEKEFVNARTLHEPESKLLDIFPGFGYGNGEVTRKDNFISPYIGKTYNGATEVLSTGLESLFEPGHGLLQKIVNGDGVYKKITDDTEYLNLIIGLILKG